MIAQIVDLTDVPGTIGSWGEFGPGVVGVINNDIDHVVEHLVIIVLELVGCEIGVGVLTTSEHGALQLLAA